MLSPLSAAAITLLAAVQGPQPSIVNIPPGDLHAVPERTITTRVIIGAPSGDPEHELFRVAAALQLNDGQVVILNSGSQEVRLFDATGRFVTSQGR